MRGILMSNYGFCRQIYITSILREDWDWRNGAVVFLKDASNSGGLNFEAHSGILHAQALSLGII